MAKCSAVIVGPSGLGKSDVAARHRVCSEPIQGGTMSSLELAQCASKPGTDQPGHLWRTVAELHAHAMSTWCSKADLFPQTETNHYMLSNILRSLRRSCKEMQPAEGRRGNIAAGKRVGLDGRRHTARRHRPGPAWRICRALIHHPGSAAYRRGPPPRSEMREVLDVLELADSGWSYIGTREVMPRKPIINPSHAGDGGG